MKMPSLRFLLLLAAQCTISFGISIGGSTQIIYNPEDPATVRLECLNSNAQISDGVKWTRNEEQVSNENPLILDREAFGEDPQLHEGRYRCIYNEEQSSEVEVYGELKDDVSVPKFTNFYS